MSAYLKLRGDGPSFLLESAEQGQRVGRWSFLGFRPRATIRMSLGDHPDPYAARRRGARPLPDRAARRAAAVRRRRRRPVRVRPGAQRRADGGRAQPRRGGHPRPGADGHRRAAGVRPPAPRGDGPGERPRRRGIPPTSSARTNRRPPRSPRSRSAWPAPCRSSAGGKSEPPEFISNLGPEGFAEAVERAERVHPRRRRLPGGAVSQRWTADCPVDAFSIYRGLRAINPSPYMYFLDFEDFEIAGASPESLVKVGGRHVELQPIAGTRPRSGLRQRAGRRAARRREGARRARDARRPGPQRPRAASASTAASRSTS